MKMSRLAALLLTIGILAFPTLAFAQYVDRDDNVRFEEEFDDDAFMITARARAIDVPGFIVGAWFDQHANHW